MVKQQRRTDRCFLPAAAQVRFPVGRVQRRSPLTQQVSGRKWAGPGAGCGSSTTEEDGGDEGRSQRGDAGSDGGSGETEPKRARVDGLNDEAAAPTNREKLPVSCDQPRSESGSTEGLGSLKVTIQQSSESREFGASDRAADRQTSGLHCHICNVTCRSLQVFQEHMSGSEHLRKLNEITQSISLNTHTLQNRGRRPDSQRWCDTCQTNFSGDVIVHRRTEQHRTCKQMSRPFCPACKRHFRTPRKFVEHMKSSEHKQQVQQEETQEEELITVDAVGCFQEEEEEDEEEEQEEEEEEDIELSDDEEEEDGGQEAECKETHDDGFDPDTTYGSSFVVPVSGFLCRLCNKFFYRETTARHTHCRTHTHYLNLQALRQTSDSESTTS
ncbi:cdkn1a interacting zinc finger protein 1b isoform X2 [Scomber scombrus]|uniref:Cdkn1a interacting zinc finger protein 1b isoform X2 n=1 Tax=Scomber scombrus TaxID=13677 RepID=A0AAV1QE35_SCOSC